jgi:hypothetical protein
MMSARWQAEAAPPALQQLLSAPMIAWLVTAQVPMRPELTFDGGRPSAG